MGLFLSDTNVLIYKFCYESTLCVTCFKWIISFLVFTSAMQLQAQKHPVFSGG